MSDDAAKPGSVLALDDRKTAIVTGAASGIGRATAVRLLESGFFVWLFDRDAEGLESLAGTAHACAVMVVDVSDEAQVREALNAVAERSAVDLAVNAAGIGCTTDVPSTTEATWDSVMGVNAKGTFFMCKHVLPKMAGRRDGVIVNIASIAGLVGLRRRAAYCASKGAVIALTRAMALDHVADGIRVNCICPGTGDSPWVRRLVEESGESIEVLRARQPMGRLGYPEEIAAAVLYLASDDARFITGSALVIDGGLTAA